jgi:hypothetical protein
LNALAYRRFRETDRFGDRGVRAPAVGLQLLDDLERDIIEQRILLRRPPRIPF